MHLLLTTIVVLLCGLFVLLLQLIQAQSNSQLAISVQVPATFNLKEFTIQLNSGSFTGKNFLVDKLNVSICEQLTTRTLQNFYNFFIDNITASTSTVSLDGLSVNSSLIVCSKQDASVTSLFLKSTRVYCNITSGKDTTFSTRGGFAGSYGITSAIGSSSVTGDCSQISSSNGMVSGTCSHGFSSKVTINAGGRVTSSFGAECGADWVQRDIVDPAPDSQPVVPFIAGNTTSFTNYTQWQYFTASWGAQSSSIINTASNTIQVSTGPWTREFWWLVSKVPIPALRPESSIDEPGAFTYTVSFDLSRKWRVDGYSNITNITMVVLNKVYFSTKMLFMLSFVFSISI